MNWLPKIPPMYNSWFRSEQSPGDVKLNRVGALRNGAKLNRVGAPPSGVKLNRPGPLRNGVNQECSRMLQQGMSQDRSDTQTIVDFQTEIDMLWSVDLFNDEIHTFDEVIHQLIKATGCTRGRAEDLSWRVHREGKANVYQATFEECLRVAGVLGEIGLMTQIKG